jgi:hypothetical protein
VANYDPPFDDLCRADSRPVEMTFAESPGSFDTVGGERGGQGQAYATDA